MLTLSKIRNAAVPDLPTLRVNFNCQRLLSLILRAEGPSTNIE